MADRNFERVDRPDNLARHLCRHSRGCIFICRRFVIVAPSYRIAVASLVLGFIT